MIVIILFDIGDLRIGRLRRRFGMEKAFEVLGHAKDDSGIVYLSRIPPFMKPEKVKFIFSRFGEVNRVYLEPYDNVITKKRKVNYKQGWLEFKNSEDAKECALSLNNNVVGGKGFHCDDIWNVKYLNKFKWHHLQTQLSRSKAIKQSKLRLLKAKVTKEHMFYADQIKSSQKTQSITSRLQSKGIAVEKVKKQFKQRKVIQDDVAMPLEDQPAVKDLMDKLFE
eukprot:NODE_136_length_18060_cov_0.656645.p9 type:complete len:223 gc:universal NODE_136_length_18060_cov_0.656645:15974-15306(-)